MSFLSIFFDRVSKKGPLKSYVKKGDIDPFLFVQPPMFNYFHRQVCTILLPLQI